VTNSGNLYLTRKQLSAIKPPKKLILNKQ